MEIVKVITKRYEVLDVSPKPFFKFGKFKYLREKIGLSVEHECFACSHKFDDEEDIYLAIVKGTHNRFLCNRCNDIALSDLQKEDK